jgi:DNA-binding SARP family transcriptional activator
LRDGQSVSLLGLRPKARATLQLLATSGGVPVHREVIADALWPEQDEAAGLRAVQVAVSAVRQALGGGVIREGDAYRLDAPDMDVASFKSELRHATDARRLGDTGAEVAALERALSWYSADLLPERGPEEWVVKARERLRRDAVEAAARLGELRLAAGDAIGAAAAAERGLAIERLVDGLWRLLLRAQAAAGDRAAVTRTQRLYDEALAELGLPPAID